MILNSYEELKRKSRKIKERNWIRNLLLGYIIKLDINNSFVQLRLRLSRMEVDLSKN